MNPGSKNYHMKHWHSRPTTETSTSTLSHSEGTYHRDVADQTLRDHSTKEIKLEHRIVLSFRPVAILKKIAGITPVARAAARLAYRVHDIGVHLSGKNRERGRKKKKH